MKKMMLHFVIICTLGLALAGCTKEKALALKTASLQLMLSTTKAVQATEDWCISNSPLSTDLDGRTLEGQIDALAKRIAGGATAVTITEIRKETQAVRVSLGSTCLQFSYPKLSEKLTRIEAATKTLNTSFSRLDKGYLFAAEALTALKPHLKTLFGDLSSLALNFKDLPFQNKTAAQYVGQIQKIVKNDQTASVKQISISNELRKIIQSEELVESKRQELVKTYLVASKITKDILERIDRWNQISAQDIVNLLNDWAPLTETLSGGKLSSSKIEALSTEIKTYAEDLGLLDYTLFSGDALMPAGLN